MLAELTPEPRYLEDDGVEERVVGGEVARPNSWPWQVHEPECARSRDTPPQIDNKMILLNLKYRFIYVELLLLAEPPPLSFLTTTCISLLIFLRLN